MESLFLQPIFNQYTRWLHKITIQLKKYNHEMPLQALFFSHGNARKKAVKLSSPSSRYKEKCKFIAFTFGFSLSVNISIDREGVANKKKKMRTLNCAKWKQNNFLSVRFSLIDLWLAVSLIRDDYFLIYFISLY